MRKSSQGERMKGSKVCNFVWMGALLFVALHLSAWSQDSAYFSNWPAGISPQEVGKKVAEHFVTSPHQYGKTIHYSEVATWYGALTYASLSHDDALRTELIHRFEPLLPDGAEAARIPVRHHVDDSIFGVVPLEIAVETKDPKYLALGKAWADRQWHGGKEWLAGCEDLRARCAQSMDRGCRLHRPERERHQCLRRHRQAQQLRLLHGAQADHGRLSRTSAGLVGSVGAASLAYSVHGLRSRPVRHCSL
jgi:hypothetical protein